MNIGSDSFKLKDFGCVRLVMRSCAPSHVHPGLLYMWVASCNRHTSVLMLHSCIAYTNGGCGTVALSLEIRAKFFIQGIHTNHCYYPTLGICHAQSACVRRNSFGALYQTELFYWQRGRLWWLGGWAGRGLLSAHSCKTTLLILQWPTILVRPIIFLSNHLYFRHGNQPQLSLVSNTLVSQFISL